VRCIDAGHSYELQVLDSDSKKTQKLVFVKREGANYPGNVGYYEGTTSQEVHRALIHRARYVQNQIPCWQTKLSIYLGGLIVWLYEHRAAKRHRRKPPSFYAAIFGSTCNTCGHVNCNGWCLLHRGAK
jgi:hypothetical protein